MNQQAISLTQFQTVTKAAQHRFRKIESKFPEMRAYLVVSHLGQQCPVNASPRERFKQFPAIIADGRAKTTFIKHLVTPAEDTDNKELAKKLKELWERKANQLAYLLEYQLFPQFEIRFHDLSYDLIRRLQSDELVDRKLTRRLLRQSALCSGQLLTSLTGDSKDKTTAL